MNKDDKRIYTLSEEAPAKAVIKLGVPLIMGMMIMVLYNLVDTYFIGLMHDDYQLAAVNLAYPVMMISIAISNMVGTGAASLIARSFGAGNKQSRLIIDSNIIFIIIIFTNSIKESREIIAASTDKSASANTIAASILT